MIGVIQAVQASVYQVVAGAVAPTKVFDTWAVPSKVDYPYVAMGAATVLPDDDKSKTGYRVAVGLHVWDNARSRAAASGLCQAMTAALHRQPLAVAGWSVNDVQLEETKVIDDLSGAHQIASTYIVNINQL